MIKNRMNENANDVVIKKIDEAFESLSQELDQIANAHEMTLNAMMSVVNEYGDFAMIYAQSIRERWDWTNSEVVEG